MKLVFLICAFMVVVLPMGMNGTEVHAYAQSDKRCSDFTYQQDAQEYYDSGGGRATADYYGMDADNNGIACESLPPRPTSENTFLPVILVGSMTTLFAVGGAVWWIRRTKQAAMVSSSNCPWNEDIAPYVRMNWKEYPLSGYIPPVVLRTMPYPAYLKSHWWKTKSAEAKKRADHRCEFPGCAAKGNLDVHHMRYDRGNENLEDLVVLCREHHKQAHSLKG